MAKWCREQRWGSVTIQPGLIAGSVQGGAWGDGSVVKNASCCSRGPGFGFPALTSGGFRGSDTFFWFPQAPSPCAECSHGHTCMNPNNKRQY